MASWLEEDRAAHVAAAAAGSTPSGEARTRANKRSWLEVAQAMDLAMDAAAAASMNLAIDAAEALAMMPISMDAGTEVGSPSVEEVRGPTMSSSTKRVDGLMI
jgi:hypothetical protein